MLFMFNHQSVYQYTVLLPAFSMKTITLEVIQPSTGPVCPGQEVILTCTVVRTGQVGDLILIWRQDEVLSSVAYDIVSPQFGSHTLGDFNTTADFITSTNSLVIISNATLKSVSFSNNNSTISCESPPQDNVQRAIIIVAGKVNLNSYAFNAYFFYHNRYSIWAPSHRISITDMATSS